MSFIQNTTAKLISFYNQKRKVSLIILGGLGVFVVILVVFLVFLRAPSPPEEVLAKAVAYDEIRLTWIDYQKTDSYNIYRSDRPGEGYEKISTTSGQHYLDTDLNEGTLYYYRITSVRGEKESEPTREAYAITEERGAVTGLEAENIAYNEIEITWNDFRRSEGYTVYRTDSLDRPFVRIDTTTKNRYTDTDLDSGKPYYYVVTQTIDGEESDYSSQLTVATREWLCGNELEYDDQVYSTVKIGDQCWFAENLNYETTEGSWCYDDDKENCDRYGRVYHFATAMRGEGGDKIQGVCPDRWYIPTDDDYKELERELGMGRVSSHNTGWRGLEENVGDKLKRASDCTKEGRPFCGASGFDAYMGGSVSTAGLSRYIRTHTFFWTSSSEEGGGWRRLLSKENSGIHRELADKENGFYIRCIRDDD